MVFYRCDNDEHFGKSASMGTEVERDNRAIGKGHDKLHNDEGLCNIKT